jgi:hypothetical protein
MNTRKVWAAIPLLVSGVVFGFAQEPGEKGKSAGKAPMPIYVTPFYHYEGPQVSVGAYSKKLASADAKTILEIAKALKKERDRLRAEVMYVAAVRLYDLGQKDEAVYWFYTAQYRGRVFGAILDKAQIGTIGAEAFELNQAYNAFNQLAGQYINGYAFGDLPELEKTLRKVVQEGKSLPKFAELYPKVTFDPVESWAKKHEGVSKGLSQLIEQIKTNPAFIKEQRKKNGIEGKY